MLNEHTEAGCRTLTLARPERGNALSATLVEALLQAVHAAHGDASLHTLVLRAEGEHFCTGLDLSALDDESDGSLLLRLVRIEELLAALWHSPLRTVALAQGRCWGAGADLFAACEWRVAAASTSFRFPGAGFGLVLGTRRLAERVGVDMARRCVIEGRSLSAAEALQAGLVSSIGDAPGDLPAPAVDGVTASALRAATRANHRDHDLAALVRSAARPGLKDRIVAYRAASARKPT